MTKTLLSAALIAGLGVAAFAPQAAHAVDGTINITGKVTSSTCTISGAASPATIAVTLPFVSTTALNAANAVAGRTPFKIVLAGCGALTKAVAFFEPGPTVLADGNLQIGTTATDAKFVELQLLNADYSKIALNNSSATQNSQLITLSSGAGTGTYYAQYFATGVAQAGDANSTVQFTMLYQ